MFPCPSHGNRFEKRGVSPHIINLGTRREDWLASCFGCFITVEQYPVSVGGCVDPRAGLDVSEDL